MPGEVGPEIPQGAIEIDRNAYLEPVKPVESVEQPDIPAVKQETFSVVLGGTAKGTVTITDRGVDGWEIEGVPRDDSIGATFMGEAMGSLADHAFEDLGAQMVFVKVPEADHATALGLKNKKFGIEHTTEQSPQFRRLYRVKPAAAPQPAK